MGEQLAGVPGREKKRDTGLRRTVRLAKVAGWTGGLGHASLASELASIGVGCCLADCHSHVDSAPYRAFFRAPTYGDRTHNLPNRQAAARARRAKPGANAPARQSEANAAPGRITGGGGRGGVTKPNQVTHPPPAPQTPAAAQAARRCPVRRTPTSRSPRPGMPCSGRWCSGI